MQFFFKRDKQGRERIYVGDVCVFVFANTNDRRGYSQAAVDGVTNEGIVDAINRSDAAGFWDKDDNNRFIWDECQIEVPT